MCWRQGAIFVASVFD